MREDLKIWTRCSKLSALGTPPYRAVPPGALFSNRFLTLHGNINMPYSKKDVPRHRNVGVIDSPAADQSCQAPARRANAGGGQRPDRK